MTNRPAPKPYILGIHAYVPGKSTASDGRALVKLSANENPLGTSNAALTALDEARTEAASYPDPDAKELREAIAELHGLEADRIVCGTGSGELLNCAVQAFAGEGDEILFSKYAFSLYPLLAHKVGATPIFAPDENLGASVDALLACVSERTKVVLLDNPNNPVGTWLSADEVKRLHSTLPGHVLLVLDQAYAEYLPSGKSDGGLQLAAEYENVLVTRTFSKAYGLAAERVGWATGSAHLIDMLNRIRGPFNVTVSGQKAALAAIRDQTFVEASRAHNSAERAKFVEAISALGNHGISCIPSEANFVLVQFQGVVRAETTLKALADAGYAVRHLPSQGLPDALRITIGKSSHMEDVIDCLRSLCGETR